MLLELSIYKQVFSQWSESYKYFNEHNSSAMAKESLRNTASAVRSKSHYGQYFVSDTPPNF